MDGSICILQKHRAIHGDEFKFRNELSEDIQDIPKVNKWGYIPDHNLWKGIFK